MFGALLTLSTQRRALAQSGKPRVRRYSTTAFFFSCVDTPEKTVGEFIFGRGFERNKRATLRVQRACYMADRSIFAAGIPPLPDDQNALLPRSMQQFLQFG
jgi:hypothetical protein